MAQTYMIISIVCFVLAAVFLVISIILYFKLKIKRATDFLSGKEARRTMERIKLETAVKSRRRAMANNVNYKQNDEKIDIVKPTAKLLKGNTEDMTQDEDATAVLSMQSDNTLRMEAYEDDLVSSNIGETTILSESEWETTILQQLGFEILEEITFVHSQDVIKRR